MRYMLLIYTSEPAMPAPVPGGGGTAPRPGDTAAEAQDPAAAIAPWIAYTRSLVEQGIHRGGEPLGDPSTATSVRIRDGRRVLTDGPFAETREVLGGYYIVECDDLDAALEAAAACPAASYGTIEVRPLSDMPEGV